MEIKKWKFTHCNVEIRSAIREIEIEISKNAQNKRKKFIKMYKITIYSCKFTHLVVV